MCSLALFPKINSIDAFAALVERMDGVTAGIVCAGLAASLFGSIAAFAVATATLLYKDFYVGLGRAERTEKNSLIFVRVATVVMGLLPIVLAIYTPNILSMTFLGKGLRASLSVLVLFVFFAPWFGTALGAFSSILASLVATVVWFVLGNPFGIDNAYIALLVPLVAMGLSEIVKRARKDSIALHPNRYRR